MSPSRVVIVEPGLESLSGHHSRLARDTAERAGWDRTLLAAHRSCPPLDGVPEDRLLRWFEAGPAETAERRRLGPAAAGLRAWMSPEPGREGSLRARLVGAAGRLRRALVSDAERSTPGCDPDLLRALAALADHAGLEPDDRLVFTSAEPHGAAAATVLAALRGPGRTPALAFRLMFDDRFDAVAEGSLRQVLAAGRASGALSRAAFHAETPALAAWFEAGLGAPVGVWPYPRPETAAPDWTRRPLVAAHLGEARREKGLAVLFELLDLAAEDPAAGVEWVVQLSGRSRDAVEARRAAAGCSWRRSGPFRIVEEVPGDAAYEALLARAHVVVCPHEPEAYALRNSGVAYEAAATGRLVLCRPGASFALLTPETAALAREDARAMLDALRVVAADPEGWGARAARSAERLREGAGGAPDFRDDAPSGPDGAPVLTAEAADGRLRVRARLDSGAGAGLTLAEGPGPAAVRAAAALVCAAGALDRDWNVRGEGGGEASRAAEVLSRELARRRQSKKAFNGLRS